MFPLNHKDHQKNKEKKVEYVPKRNSIGYQRSNGRWEARYRPQTKVELSAADEIIAHAFRGFQNGVFKYEFLQ